MVGGIRVVTHPVANELDQMLHLHIEVIWYCAKLNLELLKNFMELSPLVKLIWRIWQKTLIRCEKRSELMNGKQQKKKLKSLR